ncbi:response regulator [Hymenobacter sp. YC55]|uniref:response regulator n=1 Tax=Hymenobacter sp. YC55 TaxID=3034019 RepID=UPI0023F63A5C|nr:response regulator [Hymenobacter sp. YC55]MDF7811638.1 response regulator [Hymenobacter sp. YC55]
MRTVLVDDDYISVFLTEKILKREGLSEGLCSFQSPEEALRHVQQSIPNEVPDVILLDLNMPVISGWDFLMALRPYEAQLVGRCFIYVLTSSLSPSDTDRVHEFPLVAGLIHKPLDDLQIQTIHAQVAENRN